jgi:hypothetical protein
MRFPGSVLLSFQVFLQFHDLLTNHLRAAIEFLCLLSGFGLCPILAIPQRTAQLRFYLA